MRTASTLTYATLFLPDHIEVSAYAIQHRMRKIYAKVKEGTSEPNTPAKPKTDADEGTPSTTPTPSPRKRAPAANGAKARGRAKRKLAEDDEEEQPNSTKKTKQVKKEVPAAEDQI
jgi:hypothetical protein